MGRMARSTALESITPFADLLNTPSAPEPRSAQAERPERTGRADSSRRADERSADAEAAKDSAEAKDARGSSAADAADDTRSAKDTKDAKETKDGDAATSADASAKPKPYAEQSAALEAMFIDAAKPVVIAPQAAIVAVPQQLAAAAAAAAGEHSAPETDALAAIQAAAQGQRAAAAKPAQTQNGKPAEIVEKNATAAEPQTALPQIESGKDGQTNANGDKAPGDFRRAVADLLGGLDTDAPAAPVRGDFASAAKAGADAMQNLGMMTPAHAANAAASPASAATNAPAQAPAAAVPLTGLAVEITAQAQAGKNHFEIRRDPPELGRINVKHDVDRDGNVSTRLVVDRADTLDLLKRDASSLEHALQQAGLKTSDNALEFSLRQHAFAHDDTAAQNTAHITVSEDDPAPLEALRQGDGRLLGLGGGLDISV